MLPALFAQGIGGNVAVADSLPGAAIPLFGGGVPLVFFVPAGFLFLVDRAKPALGEFWAARTATRCLGSPWHSNYLRK